MLVRDHLRMPIAHVCFESRQVVQEAGYVLAFPGENQPDESGAWFHPQKDVVVERTIWAMGQFLDWSRAKALILAMDQGSSPALLLP